MDKRVRYALEYKDLVMHAADLLESSIKVNLQALQADNDKRAMDVMTEERDEEIEAKKQELATGPFFQRTSFLSSRDRHTHSDRVLTSQSKRNTPCSFSRASN